MKTLFTLVIFFVAAAAGFSAQPAIELQGVVVGAGPTKLSLINKADDTTRWVEVGQSFAGYKITAYDSATETATLTKEGAPELRLRRDVRLHAFDHHHPGGLQVAGQMHGGGAPLPQQGLDPVAVAQEVPQARTAPLGSRRRGVPEASRGLRGRAGRGIGHGKRECELTHHLPPVSKVAQEAQESFKILLFAASLGPP